MLNVSDLRAKEVVHIVKPFEHEVSSNPEVMLLKIFCH